MASNAEDELEKALMAGFEEESDEDEVFGSSASNVNNPLSMHTFSSPQTIQVASAPLPATNQNVAEAEADDDDGSEGEEFEEVPLNIPQPAAATSTPAKDASQTLPSSTAAGQSNADSPTTPSSGRRRQKILKGTQTSLNYHGLPRRYDKDGAEIGYKEAPPAEHTYAYTSDKPIEPRDPYHAKGCQRRMIFESDPVPEDQRYKAQDAQFEKKTNKVEFPNAVDKCYDWFHTRRGVIGATKETVEDGKLPRHFVLKMGPPHGPNSEAARIAERLKTLVSHYFHTRLAKSHLTIETEIPYHYLAGQGYFTSYMGAIRGLMSPSGRYAKKLGERLTIVLAEEPTQKFRGCDSALFHPKPFDYEAEWTNRVGTAQHIFTETYPSSQRHMPDGWRPTQDQYEAARRAYLTRGQAANARKPEQVDAAIADIKLFIEEVERFNTPEASAPALAQVPEVQPSLEPPPQAQSVAWDQQNVLEGFQAIQSFRATTASPAPTASPSYFATAPTPTIQARSQQEQPHLIPEHVQQERRQQARQVLLGAQAVQNRPRAVGSSWGYTQPAQMTHNHHYPGREDRFSSVASFGVPQGSLQQYWQQQYQMQSSQHQFQNQREPPEAYLGVPAPAPAPMTASRFMVGLTAMNTELLNASALGKRKGDDDETGDEQAQKRVRKSGDGVGE